jgi:hypothetical protein
MKEFKRQGGRFTRQHLLQQLLNVDPKNTSWQEKAPDVRDAILKQLDAGTLTL